MIVAKSTKGIDILFSDADADLAAMRWFISGKGYPLAKDFTPAHRLVLARMIDGLTSAMICDHINRNRCDVRRENLRVVTASQNLQNQSRNTRNTSGYRGVSYCANRKKWIAEVTSGRKHFKCGRFATAELAAEAAAKKRAELGFL